MGYWGVSASSSSLFTALHEDTELLWGDAPADCLDAGIDRLIIRLRTELGRFPTVDEVEAVKADAPEMVAAIAEAKQVFEVDIERPMLDVELEAGLRFADTGISLDCAMRRDIHDGDTIRWAVMKDCGFFQEVDYIHEGVVDGEGFRELKGFGGTYKRAHYNVRDAKGVVWAVDKPYANKVLATDDPIEKLNADRRAAMEKADAL